MKFKNGKNISCPNICEDILFELDGADKIIAALHGPCIDEPIAMFRVSEYFEFPKANASHHLLFLHE